MALDGIFLHNIWRELHQTLAQDARIDKIHQPSREDFLRRGISVLLVHF